MINPKNDNELAYKIELTKKQTVAWEFAFDKTTTELGYGGGGGGGKSWLSSGEYLTYMCLTYEETRWGMGRKELKNLKRTSLVTFFKVCREHNLKAGIHFKYNQQDSIIRWWNGSEILLLDLAAKPSDPLFTELGGLELTGAVIEESNEVSVLAVNILKTRVGRWNNQKYGIKPILIETFNPDKGHVYHRYYKPWKGNVLPKHRRFVRALPTDNPHLPQSYIDELHNADKVTKERLLFGNFEYDDDPSALMDTDAISDIFSNTAEKNDKKYMTVDVARFGMDKSIIMCWKGLRAYKTVSIPKCRIDELVERAEAIRKHEQIPLSHVIADEDGVGGGFVDYMKCKGFVGNATPFPQKKKDKDGKPIPSNYINLRSQCYYALSDYVNKALIAIDCHDDNVKQIIIEELEQIKGKDIDKDGKRKVIAKDEIKEHIGRSPDYSDTLMMRMWFEVNTKPEPSIRMV